MPGGGQSQRATCDADCTPLEHRGAAVIQVASRRPLPLGWSNQCRSVGYGALTTHRRAPEIGAKQGAPMPRTAVRTGVHDITRGAGDHGRAVHPPMGVQQPSERRPDSAGLPVSPELGRAPLAPEASPSLGVRAPDGERSTAPVVSAPRQFTYSGDAASRRAAQGAVDGATRSHAAPFPRSTPLAGLKISGYAARVVPRCAMPSRAPTPLRARGSCCAGARSSRSGATWCSAQIACSRAPQPTASREVGRRARIVCRPLLTVLGPLASGPRRLLLRRRPADRRDR